jgi:hypothetical protein
MLDLGAFPSLLGASLQQVSSPGVHSAWHVARWGEVGGDGAWCRFASETLC